MNLSALQARRSEAHGSCILAEHRVMEAKQRLKQLEADAQAYNGAVQTLDMLIAEEKANEQAALDAMQAEVDAANAKTLQPQGDSGTQGAAG